MRPVFVTGHGLWAPDLPGRDDPREPAGGLLDPRLARRMSLLTRAAAFVAGQALGEASREQLPIIHATAYGETQTLGVLLEMLYDDGQLSPTRFHNSVANTATGYLSIATGNRSLSTTIEAGPDTIAMALLDAMTLVEERGTDVLLVAVEETPPAPFPSASFAPLAAALRLSPAAPKRPISLTNLRPSAGAPAPIPEAFAKNPCGPILGLVEAIVSAKAGTVALCGRPDGWFVDVEVPVG